MIQSVTVPPPPPPPEMASPDPCNLIVNYIPTPVTDEKLRELFAPYGTVVSARVIVDRFNNHPKGYGFVKYTTKEAAKNAIRSMNGYKIGNKHLRVTQANGPQNHFRPHPAYTEPTPQALPATQQLVHFVQQGPYTVLGADTAHPQIIYHTGAAAGQPAMYQTVFLAQPPPPPPLSYVTSGPQGAQMMYAEVPKQMVLPFATAPGAGAAQTPNAQPATDSLFPPYPRGQAGFQAVGCTASGTSNLTTSSQALTVSNVTTASGAAGIPTELS